MQSNCHDDSAQQNRLNPEQNPQKEPAQNTPSCCEKNICRCTKCCCKRGPAGPAGPIGPAGPVPDDVFASFSNYALLLTNSSLVPLIPEISDPTGQISFDGPAHIVLEPGYYLISYSLSAILRTAGYIQVTPSYNNAPHIEKGIYFKTGSDTSSAEGSAHFILYAPSQTRFSLTFNSPANAIDGEITMTIMKLRRQTADKSTTSPQDSRQR